MKHCCEPMEKIVETEGTRLRFDQVYLEYNLAVLEGHDFYVVYCPFCGTKMPQSKRSEFFTKVSKEEETRLLNGVADCRSRGELQQRLGLPDREFPKAEGFDPIWKRPFAFPATAVYSNLSETAQLRVTFDEAGVIITKLIGARCTRNFPDEHSSLS